MRHYTAKEWLAFNKGELSETTIKEMEDHLVFCDMCMNRFLESLQLEDIEKAEEMIPADFTANTLLYIKEKSRPEPSVYRKNTWKGRWQNIFVYYVAAAVLTIAFVGGGVFQSLVDNYSQFSRTACSVEHQKMQETVRLDWPGQIADRTARWIEDFENKN